MPIVDMPVSELMNYQGSSPKPLDFDEYWTRALKELDEQDPEIELIPASFRAPGAECFDLWFTGVGGSRIHAKYLRPSKVSEPHPAVLMFHGYTGSCGDWQDKLSYVLAGYSIAALDCRGQGGLSEDKGSVAGNTMNGQIIRGLSDDPDKLLFRNIYLDTAELARIVMSFPEVDENRVGCFGGSQGGGLTLACASLEPRIRRAAPQYPFLSDYKRVWDMDLDIAAYAELKEYFRHFDPRHEREEEIFTKLGYIDIEWLTPRIRGEVLMFTGLMDTVCPPSTQFAAYNHIVSSKTVKLYPDFGHEYFPEQSDMTYEFMLGL